MKEGTQGGGGGLFCCELHEPAECSWMWQRVLEGKKAECQCRRGRQGVGAAIQHIACVRGGFRVFPVRGKKKTPRRGDAGRSRFFFWKSTQIVHLDMEVREASLYTAITQLSTCRDICGYKGIMRISPRKDPACVFCTSLPPVCGSEKRWLRGPWWGD